LREALATRVRSSTSGARLLTVWPDPGVTRLSPAVGRNQWARKLMVRV
jgi:hypothetical protein